MFELLLTNLKRASIFVLQAGVTTASLVHLGGSALSRLGLRRLAMPLLDGSIAIGDRSRSRRIFQVRQSWEFSAERNRHLLGRARVEDPLFAVSVSPQADSRPAGARRMAEGYYEVSVSHRGLRVDGFLRRPGGTRQVEVRLNGVRIRETEAVRIVPGLDVFVVQIQRDALARFPARTRLTVSLAGGGPLLFKGCTDAVVDVPHGAGDDPENIRIDKKGFLVQGQAGLAELQEGFLATYSAASAFFHREFGTPLFLLYGTLLGQQRGADFIPGDDDFDVGYWSDAGNASRVRDEAMDLVVRLVRGGFVVTLNREGRLFRLRLPGNPPACHLDVHAVWHEKGSVWIHPRANLDCKRGDFLPAMDSTMRGIDVLVPARPESFLASYYGSDWQIPNPAYSTAARPFAKWKLRLLRRAFVTPLEVARMQSKIGEPGARDEGMLVPIGSQSIYPLERYEQICDW
ncbi:hypothetical protein [Arenimonas donghaensis]|uniref:hypothetical protein n=1 Tax=Arenimonas donghaensis TaxID=375061 RepID=UPI001267A8E6|nr:hypothetical protein [Arenimonas donghaensis]